MDLHLFSDHRFYRDDAGVVFSATNYNYPLYAGRYLGVFDRVRVVARVGQSPPRPRLPDERMEGPGVEVVQVGDWSTYDLALRWHTLSRTIRGLAAQETAVIMNAPGTVGGMALGTLLKSRHPYGVEVIGDPYDVYAPGAMHHPLRPVARWWFARQLRRQCAGACGVGYVSETYLQERYPPAPDAFRTHYSSIELREHAFVAHPRPRRSGVRLSLVSVGSMAQMYKGHDLLIEAVAACVKDGLDLELVLVGGGRHQAELAARADALGLAGRATFTGLLSAGEEVRDALDRADLFVLAARAEGLPRAMIEAMARGLPCIGTTVGGIPELLPVEDMVPPNDVVALTTRIRQVVTDAGRMAAMSARNLERAQSYRHDVLQGRRTSLYEHLRDATAGWLRTSAGKVRSRADRGPETT